MDNKVLELTINGIQYGPDEVPEDLKMIDYLHEYLNLTGSRLGCGQGICHACVVIVDNPDGSSHEMRTCINSALYFNGKNIRTIEGISGKLNTRNYNDLNPIQKKFVDHFSFQCSYCTPGFVNAATILLEQAQKKPINSSELNYRVDKALKKHICRCTGYIRYYEATRQVLIDLNLVKDS